jgi:hypothetical protein
MIDIHQFHVEALNSLAYRNCLKFSIILIATSVYYFNPIADNSNLAKHFSSWKIYKSL